MIRVFREVRRVLRDDGTLWLNLGDTYTGGGGYCPTAPSNQNGGSKESRQGGDEGAKPPGPKFKGLPSGNLVGVPWRVALALQADGWVLRQDIIWAKPSPMPESVRNRCTKAHEYVFLLTKSNRYFYDAEAIREPASGKTSDWSFKSNDPQVTLRMDTDRVYKRDGLVGANKRSVWSVASQGFSGAHFATFPPNLIRPMILAGTSERGCCARCGAPWRRVVEERKLTRERPNDYVKRTGEEGTGNSCANSVAGVEVSTVGWEPTCECRGRFEKAVVRKLKYLRDSNGQKDCSDEGVDTNVRGISGKAWQEAEHGDEDYQEVAAMRYVSDLPLDEHPVTPCVVLDPFEGSGTIALTCVNLGRRHVGSELSREYFDMIVRRLETRLFYDGRGAAEGVAPDDEGNDIFA
jgi:DNA modification methylase